MPILGSALLLGAPALAQTAPPAPTVPFAVPVVQLPLPTPAPPTRKVTGIADIVRARFPLRIDYSDLGAGWRELNLYGSVYYTKGETTFLNDDEYLVAYRQFTPGDVRDFREREYVAYLTGGINAVRPGSSFPITLLRTTEVVGAVTRGQTGLRSFAAAPAPQNNTTSDAFNQNLSVIFLRKIGEALTKYAEVNLNVLPPLDSAALARQNLEPLAENGAIFLQPGTRAPFRFNPILSGRKKAHLRGKSSWVVAYEGTPASDGSRAVLRLNGTASRVNEKTWNKLKEASNIE